MQANTHFLVSIFLIKLLELIWPLDFTWFQIIIFAAVAFFSHYPVDLIVKFTYHPEVAKPKDKFWVGYHIYAYLLSTIIFFWLMSPYWWIMFFSCIVDIIDWLVLRVLFHRSNEEVWFHPSIMRIRDKYFAWIPDLTEKNAAIIPELIITGLLIWGIIIL